MGYLRCILLLFEAMSWLRVNLSKSSLILIGKVTNIHYLAHFFGGGVSALLSTYLGLPLGASFKCKSVWDPIVERFRNRLPMWKSKMLSNVGKLTPLQFGVFCFITCPYLQFRLALLVNWEKKIMSDFLWSKHARVNGFHWLS